LFAVLIFHENFALGLKAKEHRLTQHLLEFHRDAIVGLNLFDALALDDAVVLVEVEVVLSESTFVGQLPKLFLLFFS